MAFLCGVGSFSSHAEDDPWTPSTPTGSKRRQNSSNPYSSRGLDKFSLLLADLETRREKIMAAGSQGVALVRFAYSSSDDWVPIVVRLREQPAAAAENPKKSNAVRAQKSPSNAEKPPAPSQPTTEQAEATHNRVLGKRPSWKVADTEGSGLQWWRPSHYLPVAVVLVLLCLAVSGRAFAVCCTTIWWYFLPIAAPRDVESRDVRRRFMKNDYTRRASDGRLGAAVGGEDMAAPPQGRRAGGLEGLASPRRQHGNAKRVS